MRTVWATSIIAILLLSVLSSIPATFSQQQEGNNWIHPAYDVRNSGFSPQTKITKNNVRDLELKWIFQVPGFFGAVPGAAAGEGEVHVPGEEGEAGHEHEGEFGFEIPHVPTGIQTVPLVINGIVYIANDFNRLYAIRAGTNELLWRFAPPIGEFGEKSWWNRVFAQHGLDYHDAKIWMQASDCTVYGLDPQTGEVLVEIPDTCKDIPGNTGIYFGSFAPIIYKNLLITRPSGGAGLTGERGFIAAYDVNTKELVWRWFSVPPTGGDPEWNKDAGKGNINPFPGDWGQGDNIGGGSVWTLIALDEQTGTIYITTTAPTPDIDGSLRPGPNLYTASVVALDASTGVMKWYYQMIPHDILFHESRWSVILADINVQGSQRKAVIAGAKSNYVYVLDAETGKPIYEPIRVGPPSVNAINDNAGNNADFHASQRPLIKQQVCPGFQGGVDAAPAFAHNTIYVVTQTFCTSFIEEKGAPYKGRPVDILHHVAGPGYFGSYHSGNASLYAIDANNGRIKWVFEIPSRQQYGAITTTGGIVFVPDRLGNVWAIEEETGKLLRKWDFGGLGGAGVSVGAAENGEMMLFIATGGAGEFGQRTTGILAAFGLPRVGAGNQAGSVGVQTIAGVDTLSLLSFGVAVVAIIYAVSISLKYRKKN